MSRFEYSGVSVDLRNKLLRAAALGLGILALAGCGSKVQAVGKHSGHVGNDVSYPQCGESLSKAQAFGIVGVNDNLANNSNPCFSQELAWAEGSTGSSEQPKAALYVHTSDPGTHVGNIKIADWPESGKNIYGTCTGGNTRACDYQYGSERAEADVQSIAPNKPGDFTWWLDTELGYSWQNSKSRNSASIEGMVSFLLSKGAKVGIYSDWDTWQSIAGDVGPKSDLNGLNDWVLGANSLNEAKANCSTQSFTNGEVTLAQFTTSGIDGDYSCR